MSHKRKSQYTRFAIVLASIGLMVWLMLDQWSSIRSQQFDLNPGLLAFAFVGLVVLFFMDAYGWQLILLAIGVRSAARDSVRIWMYSSLTRYLPGGIWGYVSRVKLCDEQGIPVAKATLSMYLETALLLVSSLMIGTPSVAATTGIEGTIASGALLITLMAITIHPSSTRVARRLPGRLGHLFKGLQIPSLRSMSLLLCYYLVFWVGFGAVFLCFVLALHPLPAGAWMPVASAMSLGFFVGFAAFFAPSGIGARESTIYLLLLPFLPGPVCALIAVASRIWITTGELVAAALATFLLRSVTRL